MSQISQAQRSIAPLLTPTGWELLNSLPEYDAADSVQLNQKLRSEGHDAELVAAVLTQQQLRHQAKGKFGEFASRMLFTRQGLEQSTRLAVAAHHGQRFKNSGVSQVYDLGSGLGGDAMAIAACNVPVTAVEVDEAVAAAATINLMPFPNASVEHASVTNFLADKDLTSTGLWFDPARRTVQDAGGAKKHFNPDDYSPSLHLIADLVDQGLPVGVKLSPGMPHDAFPESIHSRGEIQYVSHNHDLVEVTLWFNALARDGVRRSALILNENSGAREYTSSIPLGDEPAARVEGMAGLESLVGSGYLYEPDPALIRSRLLSEALAELDGFLFDEHIAYFGATTYVKSPAWQAYRVESIMPYNIKKLRSWVKAEGIGSLTIKKRGMDVTPEELRNILLAGVSKAVKKKGLAKTLVLTRVGDQRLAILVTKES